MSRRKEIASMGTRNENSQGLEEHEEEVECLEDNPSTKQITNGSGRIVRGPTRGLSLQKKRRSKQKLDIVIHPMRKRIVGPHAMDFKTEACVIVKQNTPLEYARWKDIPKEIKLKLWMGMKQKFNLDEDYQVKDVVYAQLNRQYRNYRHKLHAHYLKRKGEGEILDQSPDGVTRDDWKQLIDYFESDHFKKMSDRNKINRQKLTMAHSCGTKSIAQYCYEERNNETGDEPTRTAAWRMSRFNSKKKEWTDEASREVYDELLRLQTEPTGMVNILWRRMKLLLKFLGKKSLVDYVVVEMV